MAPMIRTRSSSWSGWVAKIIFAFRVRARLRSEARTRRESKIRFGAGKKNLHILKTETRPLQVRSSFRIGNTRMFFSSMMPSASAAVALRRHADDVGLHHVADLRRDIGDKPRRGARRRFSGRNQYARSCRRNAPRRRVAA